MLATCDDSLIGIRDRALLLFAWSSGGPRRSEVAAADLKFLCRAGPGECLYELAHSKSNQTGSDHSDNDKPLAGEGARALDAWLAAAGIREGAILRHVLRGGHIGGPLSPAAARDVVQRRRLTAGVPGDFSAHSLRSSFVTEAGHQQVPLADGDERTSKRSDADGLHPRGPPQRRVAARLLNGVKSG